MKKEYISPEFFYKGVELDDVLSNSLVEEESVYIDNPDDPIIDDPIWD